MSAKPIQGVRTPDRLLSAAGAFAEDGAEYLIARGAQDMKKAGYQTISGL